MTVTLERTFNIDNNKICTFLGKDGEQRTECIKAQCRTLLIELFRQEVDVVLARRGFLPIPQQIKLRQNLFREGAVGPKPARSRTKRARKDAQVDLP